MNEEENEQKDRATKTQVKIRISINSAAIASQSESQSQSKLQIIVTDFQSRTKSSQSSVNHVMQNASSNFITSRTEVIEKINRKNQNADNIITRETKDSLKSLTLFNLKITLKRKSRELMLIVKRRTMNLNVSLSSLIRETSFANDLIKIFFQDNNSYLKNTIFIDEEVQKRQYSCECSLIENEIFQEKITMYISNKVSTKVAK